MKKFVSRATPLSIILNIILVINVIVVLYPVLFTISSSFSVSSSLAATSVIPFTDEKDVSTNVCVVCNGTGKKADSSVVFKLKDLKEFVADEAERQAVLDALKSGDPYRGIVVSSADGRLVTVRPKSSFLQDDLKKGIDKCQNKKLVYTVYTDEDCVSCNKTGLRACVACGGSGIIHTVEKVSVGDKSQEQEVMTSCETCDGTGKQTKLMTQFKFKKPSFYQFKRLLTSADKFVDPVGPGTKKVLGTNYKHWYLNTLKVACMNTILTVFICTTAGYIFSRFKFTGRKQIMAGMIVLQMFPSFIGMVATYVILWKFNALNTLWGLVLVYAAGSIPFNSQLMKGYFDTMPKDIAEAAYIDGASPLVAYLRVILPAAKPQIVFLTLTSFTGPWMDYIFPRMILRSDDKKTLAVGLYEMISGRSNDNFTMFAAGAILVAVPFAILFMAGQKSLLLSLAGTSGKE